MRGIGNRGLGDRMGLATMAEGGREYIVQIEPQLADLDAFRKGVFPATSRPAFATFGESGSSSGRTPSNQGEIPPVVRQGAAGTGREQGI